MELINRMDCCTAKEVHSPHLALGPEHSGPNNKLPRLCIDRHSGKPSPNLTSLTTHSQIALLRASQYHGQLQT